MSARVKAISEPGLYSLLSHYSHGGPEPVLRLLDIERQTLSLAPSNTIAARAGLLLQAGVAHGQATVISELDGTPPDSLDEQMQDARTKSRH